jgi:alginate O-acetyltransferase complex protein AlgJ
MFDLTSLRRRYTQFFVLLMLSTLVYMMVNSIGSGMVNFQDNLYKKDFLIEKAALLRIKIGDRVFPAALLGKDGWMEYTGKGALDDFQNLRTLENQKNLVLVRKLRTFNQYLKSQGITLLIVVAPNKATIYPDKLPDQIKTLPAPSRLDILISYLEDNDLPLIVDLRPALRAARQYQDVYYKTNTHWNGYGAFVAYKTIINALASSHPVLKPYETSDLKLVSVEPAVQDIPTLMRANFIKEPTFFFAPAGPFIQTLYFETTHGYDQFSSIQESKLPTLLMFHDSFGKMYLDDYLKLNFGKSHFVYLDGAPKYLTKESILHFKPDIIIIEIVERDLELLPGYISNFSPR